MPGIERSQGLARFEDFELDLRAGELRRNGSEPVRLADQPFRILVALLEHPREVVLREDIRKRLWPNDTIVEFEHSISAAMNRLRQALGDSGDNPRYIETVARRGYRWMVPVEWVELNRAGPSRRMIATESTPRTAEGLIGKKVSHYRILEVLGGGGMGVVYRAEDLRLGRSVAIKFLGEEFTDDHRALERFEREARTISALDHPNICTIYEVEEHEGQPFIVMQLLQGQTLRQRIESFGPEQLGLPQHELLDIAIAIAMGLNAAHQKGIIHRDIKPANIFITLRGEIKLLDFGLAKLVGAEGVPSESLTLQEREIGQPIDDIAAEASVTLTGATMGTASYMSPEQVRRQPVDARSDLFSCGAVLYEMATSRQAFRGDSLDAIHQAILNDTPPSPLFWNPDLPTELETIIGKALEKELQKRYQSASEIAADLQRLKLRESQVAATKAEKSFPTKRTAPIRSRHLGWRVLATLLGICLVVALAIGLARKTAHWKGRPSESPTSPMAIRSLAVLPLQNLSEDSTQEYFADGITEELITDLSKIGALQVISRTSVMHYKRTTKTLPEIARELNVDAVVEGSVRRSGDQVRITAQLIYAPTDRHLWGESYERSLRDVLALQSEVASAIANGIKVKVTPQEQMRLASARPVNPEAYEAYLQGRYEWNKRSEEGLKKSLVYFQHAIALEPNYALAYSGLADSYGALWDNGFLGADECVPKARAAAFKALEIDDNLGEAHASLAFLLGDYDWNWAASEREYRRALELSASYANAHHWYGYHLAIMGRHAEALAEIKKARQLDPLSPRISVSVGILLYLARQYDQALEELNKASELHPSDAAPHVHLGMVYLRKGMPKEAIAEFGKVQRMVPFPLEWYRASMLAEAYVMVGEQDRVRKMAQELEERAKSTFVSPTQIGLVYAALGERQKAFAWLEEAYQRHDAELSYLKVDPKFDTLRSDPRFADLLHRMRFQT